MVGQLIRARRVAKGLTQIQLAATIGTSQRQITRWERYTTEMPRQSSREQLSLALGIHVAEWHEAAGQAEISLLGTPAPRQIAETRDLSDAAMLVQLGAEAVVEADAPPIEEFVASARTGRGNLIPQNYDEMRRRRTKRPAKTEPTIFKLRVSGDCMRDTVRDGEIVWFDTTLPREPVALVFAVRDEHEAHIKRLVRRSGALWLEADDGWAAPVDEHWRILARAYTAQRGLL